MAGLDGVAMQGRLRLQTGWLIKRNDEHHFFLKDSRLAHSASATEVPLAENVYDLHGCDLKEGGRSFAFDVRPTGAGKWLHLQAQSEDDKVAWMTAIFEAKLTAPSTASTSESCTVS